MVFGWERILDPERLKEDKRLIESKEMIRKAREIVNKYRGQTYMLAENLRKDIDSLDLIGVEQSKSRIEAVWNLEAGIISECESIIALLSARKNAWVVSDGHLLFYNNADLDRYNAYWESMQNLVQQQEAIQKQGMEAVNESIKNFKQ